MGDGLGEVSEVYCPNGCRFPPPPPPSSLLPLKRERRCCFPSFSADDQVLPEASLPLDATEDRFRNSTDRTAGPQYIFETRFPPTGGGTRGRERKKRTISSPGEGSSRVLIIQHTPNKWASFLEAPLALGSRMLSALVAHLTISSRPYGESFCHESKSLAACCCDLRGYASRTGAILFFFFFF